MGDDYSVAVSDQWVGLSAFSAGVKVSTRWGAGPCGPDMASFTVDLDPTDDSSWLRLKSTCEVYRSGVKVFGGRVSEVSRDFPREVHAKSWARFAADFDALDASGNPTTNPRTAVTQAIARGLPWTDATAFDNVSFGTDGTPGVNRLDKLLNAQTAANGKRWGVDVDGAPFVTTDPITPTWWLDAEGIDIGVADDGLYTRVNARYVSAITGTPAVASAWSTVTSNDTDGQALYGIIEYSMDLTPLGYMTSTTAQAYADQQRLLLTVPQWLSSLSVNNRQLVTEGNLPADLASVAAGQLVRLFNVPTNLGGLRNELGLDVVLGSVDQDGDNPDTIPIAPVGLAVRDFLGALVAAKQAADKAAEDAGMLVAP